MSKVSPLTSFMESFFTFSNVWIYNEENKKGFIKCSDGISFAYT